MDTIMPILIMLGVGVFALAQNSYYSKKIKLIEALRERELLNAESKGRREALQDPKAVMHAYHKMFTYTMN